MNNHQPIPGTSREGKGKDSVLNILAGAVIALGTIAALIVWQRLTSESDQPNADSDEPQGDSSTLPPALDAGLKVLAGAAGATAVLAALLALVGWQYQRSYYETLGIPLSTLTFSTQDYLFATLPSVTFAIALLAGSTIGLAIGLVVPWPADLRGLLDLVWRRGPIIVSVLYGVGFAVSYAVLVLGDLTGPFTRDLTLAITIAALLAILVSLTVTALLRSSGKAFRRVALGCSVFFVVVFVGAIAFVPRYLGSEAAGNDSSHFQNFSKAILLVKGTAGIPPSEESTETITHEHVIAVKTEDTEAAPESCEEFVPTEKPAAPKFLCELSEVIVVLRNNDSYFLSTATSENAEDRAIYVIPEERIVRITLISQ